MKHTDTTTIVDNITNYKLVLMIVCFFFVFFGGGWTYNFDLTNFYLIHPNQKESSLIEFKNYVVHYLHLESSPI